ncbi:Fe-S cluster assembly sulfur transfer protein SufU [Timonella sp. A28]|uniref:Fe-S cluster assembly sulfur transfer protein SufU n=1 Tax=Timonella sp. A28 TaxID=3442640 RepID=UPI003EBD8E0C
MEQLYQQVILDHAKHPHGKGLVEIGAGTLGGESHQVNPTCGDEVTMRVSFSGEKDNRTISQLTWDGQGCSISQASISVLAELVTGKTVTEAEHVAEVFRELMNTRGKGFPLDDDSADVKEELLEDATAFTGVSKFPARIKCALLGWSALRDTFAKTGVLTDIETTYKETP